MYRFAAIFVEHLSIFSGEDTTDDHITPMWVIKRATSSAAFWELASLRSECSVALQTVICMTFYRCFGDIASGAIFFSSRPRCE